MKRHLGALRHRRAFALVVVLVAVAAVPSIAQYRQSAGGSRLPDPRYAAVAAIAADTSGYAARIVSAWEPYASESGFSGDGWRTELTAALLALTPDKLYDAGQATTYADLVATISGRTVTNRAAVAALAQTSEPLALGSETGDLVYFPVTPCRLIDTRSAAQGMFAANETRSFWVNGSLTYQGGNPAGCGLPSDPAAVALNLTVTGSSSWGWLTAWAASTTMPNASVLNWNAYDTHANTTTVPLCQYCGSDISLKAANAPVHVIADVVGYYWSPTATALSVTQQTTTQSVGVGADMNIYAPDCPVGTTVTGGGYLGSLAPPWSGLWVSGSAPSGTGGWMCSVSNQTATAVNVTCYAMCAKVPGR